MPRTVSYGHTEPEREVPRPRRVLAGPYSHRLADLSTQATASGRKPQQRQNADQGRHWNRTRG